MRRFDTKNQFFARPNKAQFLRANPYIDVGFADGRSGALFLHNIELKFKLNSDPSPIEMSGY